MSSISENVDDRYSMLSEEIISEVLSLMPTKFVVRTSILSKRWRYTWTSVTNLDFSYSGNDSYMNFIKFVNRVLAFCKTCNLFRLHISSGFFLSSIVSDWVNNAIGLNARELDIVVMLPKLPSTMFTCKTLTKLRLQLKNCEYDGWKFSSRIYLPSLKNLDLLAGYFDSFCTAFEIIYGCPVLESLSLDVSCHSEDECVFNIPTLKRLKLIYKSGHGNVNNKVVLRVPNLEYMFVGGLLGSCFVMEDVSSLVEASIICLTNTGDYLWADLLNKITTVRKLSIQIFRFTSPLPIFPNLQQLELNGVWKPRQITHILRRCPELKILCVDIVHWGAFKSEKSSRIEFDTKLIPACMLTNLTTIKFSQCKGETNDIAFLEYMLGNAQVLKAVKVFACENLLIAEDPWFCTRVLKIPRASRHCEIHFRP